MPITMINNQVDDQISLITHSHMYPGVYSQMSHHQGNDDNNPEARKPPRRRRRKSKSAAEDGGGGSSAAGGGKRKLSEGQVSSLEKNFEDEHKLESERKDRLAKELGLDPRQVAVWFQNRRARWKNKKLEEEYSSLKKLYDNVVLHKSNLESQVLRLTEQLNEADREIQKLAERVDIGSSNSPVSSLTVEPPFFGDFAAPVGPTYDQYPTTDGFYVAEDDGYLPNVEWMLNGLYM